MSDSIRVLVTGAAGQIAYSILPIIAKGDVFGPNQSLILHLLDIPPMAGVMNGVVMELTDCAYPLLTDVIATTDEAAAFKDIDVAFLVGSMPRKEGMERKDLLAANVKIFASQGRALAAHAKPNVKVLVVGNPANTNALVCSKFAAPKIPIENFTAMTRLDQNRAKAQFAAKHNARVGDVQRIIIWGNHSSTQFPDVSSATINGKTVQFTEHDDALISLVQKRGAAVIAARKLSSAMSAAKAAADHMRDWWCGTSEWVSMGVISNGNSYGAPEGIIFSFPVTVDASKQWKIVDGVSINDFAKERLRITGNELIEERGEAFEATSNA